ncbi:MULTISPECIES: hypothetical protein [unclassified Bradyrhizobium]|uniref:hypothetical protein n=1 Tax=unclassified Bradyrhizobium TaxID=2631580 RepID=UPI002916E8DB|nr:MULTISPECIES: hypothetical protein [unclassified Bradyrhizobium]
MKPLSSQQSFESQTKVGSHSGHRDGDNPNNACSRSTSDLAKNRRATDDDLGLLVLGKQLEEALGKIRSLYDPASPDHLDRIETMLADLAPVEQAIMGTPARTIAGLGVKARHAAYVVSEYWDTPLDQNDWHARAVRSLIEAVCEVASVPYSFEPNPTEEN